MGVIVRSVFVTLCVAALGIGGLISGSHSADAASVRVQISRGSQTMKVYVGGKLRHRWLVSTGRRGYGTPSGTYSPKRMHRMWYSRKYDNSPRPHSIFFRGGYAIHGTNYVSRLGRRASHGCIRLAPRNAARLYRLVKRYGSRNTRITIR